jgi:SAM-dependent methyltransferase
VPVAALSPDRIKTRLRLALPAPAKRAARVVANALDPLVVRRYRAATGELRPLPPGKLRTRTCRPDLRFFIESARQSADELESALASVGRRLGDFEAVLDFGCGCARVLAELEQRLGSGAALLGCDIDAEAIRWAQRNHPAMRFAVNGPLPPLPYDDGSFDLLFASSVFTHVNEAAQQAWLEELTRVLAPGGLAIVSVYGEHAFSGYRSGEILGVTRDFRERLSTYESLDDAGMVFEPYPMAPWNRFNYTGGDEPYGVTFNSSSQVRRDWSRRLEVLEILPQSWWSASQDLVILSRPQEAVTPARVAAGAAD